MVSLKYVKEYRLDTFTDENGKVKDCTVYIGPLFEWGIPYSALKTFRGRLCVLILIQVVFFISSLWNYSDMSRLWWVIVPYCCLLFVFLYQIMVCYNLFTVKGQFHREKKEKTVDRMKGCSVMGTIVTGICFLAATLSMMIGLVQFSVWELWFVLTVTVLLLGFLCQIKLSKKFQVRRLVNPKAIEWENR